jgi:heptosyltransferase-2
MDAAATHDVEGQSKTSSVPNAKRALIVRLPNWVGEAVLCLPTLALLQDEGYRLHLVGKPWASDLFAGHDWPVHTRPTRISAAIAQLWRLRRQLSAADASFGLEIDTVLFTNSFSSALEARLAGLHALGYASEARGLLLTRAVSRVRQRHAADDYWRIGAALVATDAAQHRAHSNLTPSQAQIEQARSLLHTRQIGANYAVLCAFSGPSDLKGRKRWPAFPELARQLDAQGLTVILCPGPGEEAEARRNYPAAAIFPSISLGVYAALMQGAWCTIANDTGPGHLAAATGGTLVSVFGPESTDRWAPVGPQATLIHCASRWPALEEVIARLPPRRQE